MFLFLGMISEFQKSRFSPFFLICRLFVQRDSKQTSGRVVSYERQNLNKSVYLYYFPLPNQLHILLTEDFTFHTRVSDHVFFSDSISRTVQDISDLMNFPSFVMIHRILREKFHTENSSARMRKVSRALSFMFLFFTRTCAL